MNKFPLYIILLILFNSCVGCKPDVDTPEGIHSDSTTTIDYDSTSPCPNDPLVDMALASPGTSGVTGGLFGCRRYGSSNCSLTGYGDKPKRHLGVDILASIGTPVYSMYDGTVDSVRNGVGCDVNKAHGNRILIKSLIGSKEYIIYYCHLSSTQVNFGDTVQQGQKIGETGKTGNACSVLNEHLHVEVQSGGNHYDPQGFMTTKFDDHGNRINTCR